MVNWAQVFFNSALTGSLYLIGAVGLTLTYGLSRFPNFAHAEFITLGAFIGYSVAEQLGLGLLPSLVVSFLLTGIVGILCYRGMAVAAFCLLQGCCERGQLWINSER